MGKNFRICSVNVEDAMEIINRMELSNSFHVNNTDEI